MNVLICIYKMQDYGGIIHSTEILAQGFKDLGHSVSFVCLTNSGKSKPHDNSNPSKEYEYGYGLDLYFNQKRGWKGIRTINYLQDMNLWEEETEAADLLIWTVPVPTCSKNYKGDKDWIKLYNNWSNKQIAIVRDGNLIKRYPHIYEISHMLNGIVGIHNAAYNSCKYLEIPRIFMQNPVYENSNPVTKMENREDGFISLQVFKRWKRVDDLIKSIPFMNEFTRKIICGGGIEQYYMTSKHKIKKEYIINGERIWDTALYNGMEYLGFIDTNTRDDYLSKFKLLIDPSWSKTYSSIGSHFNRVTLEAMNFGCVPVLIDINTRGSFLKPNENYIEIPYDSSSKQYAKIIDKALEEEELLKQIQNNNLKLVKKFHKKNVVKRYIEFINNPSENSEVGKSTKEFIVNSERKMKYFQ